MSQKKLESNRRNSKLGGNATKKKYAEQYLNNPSFCKHCKSLLPFTKKNNKFCDSSCAASHNNVVAPKRIAKTHNCPQCGDIVKSTESKYCSFECYDLHRRKYKTIEEKKIAVRKNVRAISANYRARMRNQTPSYADLKAIKEFYNNCPEGYEVDHIIPISKGGLHILENLQYLPAIENRRKSNKII